MSGAKWVCQVCKSTEFIDRKILNGRVGTWLIEYTCANCKTIYRANKRRSWPYHLKPEPKVQIVSF